MNGNTDVEKLVKRKLKRLRELPELQCNHCGATFRGDHECDCERLKQQNKRYREAFEEILRQYDSEDEIDDHDFIQNVAQISEEALEESI